MIEVDAMGAREDSINSELMDDQYRLRAICLTGSTVLPSAYIGQIRFKNSLTFRTHVS